jgi:hypothetical protein
VLHVGAYFKQDQVRVEGRSTQYIRVGASGGKLRFHFCPTCGSTMFFEADVRPGVVGVPVGAFADPQFPKPSFSVWEENMHHWLVMPGEIEHAQQRRTPS